MLDPVDSRIVHDRHERTCRARERTANFLIDGSVAVPGTGLEGRWRGTRRAKRTDGGSRLSAPSRWHCVYMHARSRRMCMRVVQYVVWCAHSHTHTHACVYTPHARTHTHKRTTRRTREAARRQGRRVVRIYEPGTNRNTQTLLCTSVTLATCPWRGHNREVSLFTNEPSKNVDREHAVRSART